MHPIRLQADGMQIEKMYLMVNSQSRVQICIESFQTDVGIDGVALAPLERRIEN